MPADRKTITKILSRYKLKRVMSTDKNNRHYKADPIFASKAFKHYRSKEYLESPLCDSDEVYGYSRFVTADTLTGIRFEFSRCEVGDETEYSFDRIFVILTDHTQHDVEDVDFGGKTVLTEQGMIPFAGLKKDIIGD